MMNFVMRQVLPFPSARPERSDGPQVRRRPCADEHAERRSKVVEHGAGRKVRLDLQRMVRREQCRRDQGLS
jgi:hypothetical protein